MLYPKRGLLTYFLRTLMYCFLHAYIAHSKEHKKNKQEISVVPLLIDLFTKDTASLKNFSYMAKLICTPPSRQRPYGGSGRFYTHQPVSVPLSAFP